MYTQHTVYHDIIIFLTFSFKSPFGPTTLWKICFPTWASTALSGSSRRYMSLFWYTALARLTLCFWPPDRLMPWNIKAGLSFLLIKLHFCMSIFWYSSYVTGRYNKWNSLTFSPISVWSPAGSILRSWINAHASIISLYFVCSNWFPNKMLFFSVRCCIHACCGTYASDPWN